VGKLVSQSVIR